MRAFGLIVLIIGLTIPLVFFYVWNADWGEIETYSCKSTKEESSILGTSFHDETQAETADIFINITRERASFRGDEAVAYEESDSLIKWQDAEIPEIKFQLNKETLEFIFFMEGVRDKYYECAKVNTSST
tara:strand:- start:1094 stop:1483 length:390 start_codon:yes stop_codon:yes gene_type:complete